MHPSPQPPRRSAAPTVDPSAEQLRLITGRGLLLFLGFTQLAVVAAISAGLVERLQDVLVAPPPWMANVGVVLVVMTLAGGVILADRHNRQAVAATMRLAWLAGNDALTGLPSRRSLHDRLPARLAAAGPDDPRVVVLVFDVDRFTLVNDAHGHDAGDEVLRQLGGRLATASRADDLLVRFAGDEFVVVTSVTDAADADARARQLHAVLERPVRWRGREVPVSLSIGGAVAEPHCHHPDEVLRDADAARIRAKALGPGRTVLYDRSRPDQLPPSSAARRLAASLRDDGFVLHYQPIQSLAEGHLVGVEALIRWNDPASGLVRPAEFFHLLRATGLMVPVGRWAVTAACRQAASWANRYPTLAPVNVTINVSGLELEDPEFVAHLERSVRDTGVAPDTLYLEVAETTLADASVAAWQALGRARAMGVHLAVDDFGARIGPVTGLLRLRPELVKVDRVVHRTRDAGAQQAVGRLVELVHALDAVTLAEGVEDAAQAAWLAGLGVDLGQGYHLGSPQPASMIDQLLAAATTGDAWAAPVPVRPAA